MQTEAAELPLTHKLWAWFETNKKQATWGAIAVVIVGLGVWFVLWQRGEKEQNASEALSNVANPMLGNTGRAENPEAYLKIANTYPNSKAAGRALLLAGEAYFLEGKYEEARSQFSRCVREHLDNALMGQALLGVAASLDAQGKTNEAIVAYKDLVDHHPGENVIPQAKFALARLYEDTGRPELARPLYEELAREFPTASIGSEAGMKFEELQAKHPVPSASAVVPTIPVTLPAATSAITAPVSSPAAPTSAVPPSATGGPVITNTVPAKP